jgi:FixJ family two-component response regulator
MRNNDKTVIAIVDDEACICNSLELLLRSAGLNAKSFLGGPDFLRFLENDCPDCLVLDLNMMPMNGFSVLDHLAQLRLKLPVIVISGDDKEEIYERALNKGASTFLRKPVDGQVLLDAINDAVGQRV